MKLSITFLTCFIFIIVGCSSISDTNSTHQKKYMEYDLSMYPTSNDSIKRYIIELPIEENEGLFNLEIWAGQTKFVDCNTHRLSGKFTKKTVRGWGYSYYEFTSNSHQLSTQMACPENTVSEKFIRSKTEHIRYNSKLPVVVYCPSNMEVEYAIWSKKETPSKAKLK